MIQGELHILPTDVMPICPTFTEKTGPTRQSTQEEVVVQSRTHRPRIQWRHNLLKEVTTTTLSILILSKSYSTMVYT